MLSGNVTVDVGCGRGFANPGPTGATPEATTASYHQGRTGHGMQLSPGRIGLNLFRPAIGDQLNLETTYDPIHPNACHYVLPVRFPNRSRWQHPPQPVTVASHPPPPFPYPGRGISFGAQVQRSSNSSNGPMNMPPTTTVVGQRTLDLTSDAARNLPPEKETDTRRQRGHRKHRPHPLFSTVEHGLGDVPHSLRPRARGNT